MLIPLQQRHQVSSIDDCLDLRIVDIQVLEPIRIQLPDGEITLEHLLGQGQAELLGAEESEEEDGVSAASLDARVLLDPLAKLFQRVFTGFLVLAELRLGDRLRLLAQVALVDVRLLLASHCDAAGR